MLWNVISWRGREGRKEGKEKRGVREERTQDRGNLGPKERADVTVCP